MTTFHFSTAISTWLLMCKSPAATSISGLTVPHSYQGDLTFTFESGLKIAVTNDQLVVPVWEVNKNGIAVQNNETIRKVLINPLGCKLIPELNQTSC